MAKIINTFKENAPAMRFIGKKYPDFGGWWGEWFANGWFDQIEQAMGGVNLDEQNPVKPGCFLSFRSGGASWLGRKRHLGYWVTKVVFIVLPQMICCPILFDTPFLYCPIRAI